MYFVRQKEIFNYTKCINLHRTFKVTSSQNMYISKLLWSLQNPESLIMRMFRTVTVSAVLYVLMARLINSINCLLKIVLAECWHQFQIHFLCVSDNSTYATLSYYKCMRTFCSEIRKGSFLEIIKSCTQGYLRALLNRSTRAGSQWWTLIDTR